MGWVERRAVDGEAKGKGERERERERGRERERTKMRKEGRKSYPRLLLLFLERGRSEENGYEIGLPSPLAFGTLPACPATALAGGGGEGGQKKFHPPSCGEKRGGKRKFFLPSLSGGDVRGKEEEGKKEKVVLRDC